MNATSETKSAFVYGIYTEKHAKRAASLSGITITAVCFRDIRNISEKRKTGTQMT